MNPDPARLIPVNVLSGFLGSGKTTLLQRLLAAPELPDTAVLINEFGAVGLDHELVQHAADAPLLLDNGCLCCALRGDLRQALKDLLSRRQRGEVMAFQRLVIETSGLADPAPIGYTLLAEPVLQQHYRLGNVVTVVDAVNGTAQLAEFPEAVQQVVCADRLLLSKTDLTPATAELRARLRALNPTARAAPVDAVDARNLLLDDVYDPAGRQREVDRWLAGANGQQHDHTAGVTSFCIRFDRPLDWTAFGIWMTMLLNRHGDKVLRIKGLLNVAGLDAPVLINGVQHIVHPPTHLGSWPDHDRQSRIIFIVRDISQAKIERSLRIFNRLANPVPVVQAISNTAADRSLLS